MDRQPAQFLILRPRYLEHQWVLWGFGDDKAWVKIRETRDGFYIAFANPHRGGLDACMSLLIRKRRHERCGHTFYAATLSSGLDMMVAYLHEKGLLR